MLSGILIGTLLASPVAANLNSPRTKRQIAALQKKLDQTIADLQQARQDLTDRCPAGSTLTAGLCVEDSARSAADWGVASQTCAAADRRLPTASELWALMKAGLNLAGDGGKGEGTGDIAFADNSNTAGYWTIRDDATYWVVPVAEVEPFRCVSEPTNLP